MRKKLAILLLSSTLAFASVPATAATGGKVDSPRPSGIFDLYEQNRTEGVANYITTDFIMLSYSMIRRQDATLLEQRYIMPALLELTVHLQQSFKLEKGEAAEANRDFIAILSALLEGYTEVNGAADSKRASAELALVLKAGGISSSPLWGYSMDYSQFKPRGAYTSSEERKNYFRAMRYASSVLFTVRGSRATGVSAELADRLAEQAMMLAKIISADQKVAASYRSMNEALAFRFGRADDLVLADVVAVMEKRPESTAAARKMLFERAVSEGRQPAIFSGIIDRTKLSANERPADVLTGFRLFPQRYSADSAFFQQLVSPQGGEFKGEKQPFGLVAVAGRLLKGFPSFYELMARYGSRAAQAFIEKDGETGFSGYGTVVKSGSRELGYAEGVEKLNQQLLQVYLSSEKDAEQRLETGLAFWTWQRYVNLLYSKQSMTMSAKSISFGAEKRAGAVLEQDMSIYMGLSSAVAFHRSMYEKNGRKDAAGLWRKFDVILDRCLDIASRQKLGLVLDDEDNRFLNDLDKKLLQLTGGRDHPIVVDVHTEPNSRKVVEEGVGFPLIVTHEQARGARLSHYEFKFSLDKRLDNAEWQEMVGKNTIPKR